MRTTIHPCIWASSALGKCVVRTIRYWRCRIEIRANDSWAFALFGIMRVYGEWYNLPSPPSSPTCGPYSYATFFLLIGVVGRLKSRIPIVCLARQTGGYLHFSLPTQPATSNCCLLLLLLSRCLIVNKYVKYRDKSLSSCSSSNLLISGIINASLLIKIDSCISICEWLDNRGSLMWCSLPLGKMEYAIWI